MLSIVALKKRKERIKVVTIGYTSGIRLCSGKCHGAEYHVTRAVTEVLV